MVKSIQGDKVKLSNGREIKADAIVLAVDPEAASKIIKSSNSTTLTSALGEPRPGRGSTCLYYSFDGPSPLGDPLLVLNGEAAGSSQTRVNNMVFLSDVAPAYAPMGKGLASVTVVGVPNVNNTVLDEDVRRQLGGWFGKEVVEKWKLLKVYVIPYAQPSQVTTTGRQGGWVL